MKVLKILILFCCCVFTTVVSAQVTEIKSISSLKQHDSSAVKPAYYAEWAYILLDYNFNFVKQPGNDTRFDSFSFGFKKSLKRLGNKLPLYAESGLLMQLFYDNYSYDDDYYYGDETYSLMMLSFKIPLNIVYEYRIGSASLCPFAGLSFRANLWGELELDNGDKYDIFKESTFPLTYEAFERFQFGSQVGVCMAYGKFNVAFEMGMELNELGKQTNLFSLTLAAGFSF